MEKAQIYRGIEFIRISDLPQDQKEAISPWLVEGKVIKILKNDDQLLSDCVQYTHYKDWYVNVFSIASQVEASKDVAKSKGLKGIKLAIGR